MAARSGNAQIERGLMHVTASYDDFAERLEDQPRQAIPGANKKAPA
jgi:hypothetical protein